MCSCYLLRWISDQVPGPLTHAFAPRLVVCATGSNCTNYSAGFDARTQLKSTRFSMYDWNGGWINQRHEKNNILYWVYPSLHRAEKKQNKFFRRCNVYFWRINVLKMQKTNTTRKIGEKWATFKNTYNIPLYWLVYDKTHIGYSSIIYNPLYVASWWFQPLWKICSSNWILSPRIGVKKDCFKPPPSLCFFS